MVDDLVFIFYFLLHIRQTDGSTIRVKPKFIDFPYWMTWSSSFAFYWTSGRLMEAQWE
jgi:hypothetical protein